MEDREHRDPLRGTPWTLLLEFRKEMGDEIAAAVVDGQEPNPARVKLYRAIRDEMQRRRDEHEQGGRPDPDAPPEVEGMPPDWQ